MNIYYTYAYLREDGTPFYIGKGKDDRINKKRSFELPPAERRIFLKRNLTEDEALKHEQYIIDVIGKENLINKTTGGQGISGLRHTPETVEKIRRAATGRVKTPEEIEKWKETRRRNGKKRVYGPLSEETKKKMSEAQTGRRHSDETRRKMSETAKRDKRIDNLRSGTQILTTDPK